MQLNGVRIEWYKPSKGRGPIAFIPLPRDAWRAIEGNGCGCVYCSSIKGQPSVNAFWDTLVVCADQTHTTICHYPELHGAKKLREDY